MQAACLHHKWQLWSNLLGFNIKLNVINSYPTVNFCVIVKPKPCMLIINTDNCFLFPGGCWQVQLQSSWRLKAPLVEWSAWDLSFWEGCKFRTLNADPSQTYSPSGACWSFTLRCIWICITLVFPKSPLFVFLSTIPLLTRSVSIRPESTASQQALGHGEHMNMVIKYNL